MVGVEGEGVLVGGGGGCFGWGRGRVFWLGDGEGVLVGVEVGGCFGWGRGRVF